jgi:hypothetical protein
VYFPIDSGTHGGLACNECHQQFYDTFSCTNCHSHDQASVDPSHLPVAAYTYTPTSCYDCHPRGEAFSRADHGRVFPIVSGPHTGIACADCHTTTYPEYNCTSCHTHRADVVNPAHNGVNGYLYESTSCYTCHPTGRLLTRAEHDTLFPLSRGAHVVTSCVDCHAGGFGSFECINCHTHNCTLATSQHREVGGFSCTSSRCYACHPRGSSGGD